MLEWQGEERFPCDLVPDFGQSACSRLEELFTCCAEIRCTGKLHLGRCSSHMLRGLFLHYTSNTLNAVSIGDRFKLQSNLESGRVLGCSNSRPTASTALHPPISKSRQATVGRDIVHDKIFPASESRKHASVDLWPKMKSFNGAQAACRSERVPTVQTKGVVKTTSLGATDREARGISKPMHGGTLVGGRINAPVCDATIDETRLDRQDSSLFFGGPMLRLVVHAFL